MLLMSFADLAPECIAEFTKSPLMILNTSDIGTVAKTVEINLTKHFKRAKSWGAVLLIDEADIFMERRSTRDLERNSLVAGKSPARSPNDLSQCTSDTVNQGFSGHWSSMTASYS